jgi:beta-N-acetylhexosaminidase
MDLKKLIGSLCIFGFEGKTVPNFIKQAVSEWNLGGVILFKRNIESKEQLIGLISELRSLQNDTPLFISVDHEGGRVFRLPPPFTAIPTAREIGKEFIKKELPPPLRGGGQGEGERDVKDNIAFQTGALMGRELKEVGFNLNYAPVLDVDTNPVNPIIGDRAFSSDPEIVSQTAFELIRGLRSQGVLPCGKHFPGHGDTSLDSHLELPVVDQPLSRLQEVELAPFRAAIQNGIEMIMTAHVLYPQIDPDFPATVSKKILQGILREDLGYKGVVISDDFLMKAVFDRYGVPEAARLFLDAGGDIPLICKEENQQALTLEALEKWAKDGILVRPKLEASWERVMKLKKRMSE